MAGGKQKISRHQQDTIDFKKNPDRIPGAEKICAGPAASNFGRCEALKQAKYEMAIGKETSTRTMNEDEVNKEDWNSGINYWSTQLGTLTDIAEKFIEAGNNATGNSGQKISKAAQRLLVASKAAQKSLSFAGTLLTAAGLSTSAYSVYQAVTTTAPRSEERFTALANLGRDLALLRIAVSCSGLGLALGILNSILCIGDPNWFANMWKNPNGVLAEKITQAVIRAQNRGGYTSGKSYFPTSNLSEISESFRNSNMFSH